MREGLLAESARCASGYRHQDAAAARQSRFIARAKAQDFALQEIRDPLALVRDPQHGVNAVSAPKLERLRTSR